MTQIVTIICLVGAGILLQLSLSDRENGMPDGPFDVPEMEYPEGNEFTQARFELGRRLFYDVVMSKDSSISCSSCHEQSLAFSDSVALSAGAFGRPGTRNAPTLTNVGYHPYFTRDGSVPTLEMQILVPIQEHNEFAFNIVLIADRLNQDSSYVKMSLDAYDRVPDPYVITRALGCFERSIVSSNSSFDRYLAGDGSAMSKSAIRGAGLFYGSEANCSSCHAGFNFTDYSFTNNGLYTTYADSGRFRFTNLPEDRAVFKVPGLRNVEYTAPYMHDGSVKTLEDVVEHYSTGGKPHPNKSEKLKPINFTKQNKEDLVAFLTALSDQDLINNENFSKRSYP